MQMLEQRHYPVLVDIVTQIRAVTLTQERLGSNTNPSSNTNTGTTTSNTNPSSNTNTGKSTTNTNTNPQFASNQATPSTTPGDTTFSNGNSAQLGGPGDNGNIGRGNTGTGDIGNGNSGNGDIGNGNSANNDKGNGNTAPGQTGDFCQNGKGNAYGCTQHNPHFTG